LGQNYLKADIDAGSVTSEIPAANGSGLRLCFDGQLGNSMKEPASERQGFGEERFLMNLYREEGLGMFSRLDDAIYAFGVSDGKHLLLARDLLGMKTLFYGRRNGALYVSSELKSLAAHLDDVHEFPPGHYMDESGKLLPYAELPSEPPVDVVRDIEQSVEMIRQIIERNILTRVSFRRPTAALLSGGMDSSVVCLLASKHLKKRKGAGARLKTFAVGVGESRDIASARIVARSIDSLHREVIVDPLQVVEALPTVIYYLESFDPSLVRSSAANYLVSRAAKEAGIEVLLSGEGGDELFCGYHYFKQLPLSDLFRYQMECLGFLHNNAALRLDRMNQAHSIKVVAPLVSGDLLAYAMRIPACFKQKPQHKQKTHGTDGGSRDKTEKWILRKAFESELPPEITWRTKQEFSQGSGSSALLKDYFEDQIGDQELEEAKRDFPLVRSKEELFYFRIFTKHFGCGRAVDTVGQWAY
jgi:asparagine synthase (glutamine-hydrolysing)